MMDVPSNLPGVLGSTSGPSWRSRESRFDDADHTDASVISELVFRLAELDLDRLGIAEVEGRAERGGKELGHHVRGSRLRTKAGGRARGSSTAGRGRARRRTTRTTVAKASLVPKDVVRCDHPMRFLFLHTKDALHARRVPIQTDGFTVSVV